MDSSWAWWVACCTQAVLLGATGNKNSEMLVLGMGRSIRQPMHSEKHFGIRSSLWGVDAALRKGWFYCLQHALYLPFTLIPVLDFKKKLSWDEPGSYRFQALTTVTAPPYRRLKVMSNWQNMPCKESVTWKLNNLQSCASQMFLAGFYWIGPLNSS